VIRLWEQPAAVFFESAGFYPFAALAQTEQPESILRAVAARIEEIPERDERANLAATTAILAGLVLDRERIQLILRSDIMRESVMYQVCLDEARADAEAMVRAEARAEAEAMVRAEAESKERQLVVRQLTRKLGDIQPQLQARIDNLSIDRVESLGEALLDFTSLADLEAWLG
jgi:predicted transposase YdaD